MNNNMPVPNPGSWQVSNYAPPPQPTPGQRTYSATSILDFSMLLRIIQHWRWVVMGSVAAGLIAAILITLLTPPVYRAWVTLEANPPAFSVSDDQSRERDASTSNTYDFVATQVGLVSSKSVAERAAQELNLPNNPTLVPQNVDASQRLKIATEVVSGGLHVLPPLEGQLIKLSIIRRRRSLQRRSPTALRRASSTLRCNADTRRQHTRVISSNRQIARTRGDLERSERSLVGYAQAQGIINTAGPSEGNAPPGDTNSLQGKSLVTLNKALADVTARRVAAEGAYRQSLATGPTSEVTSGTQALRSQRATIEAEYQQKRTFMKPEHPEMLSLRSQIDELDKQIARESAQMSSGRNNSLLADYRAASPRSERYRCASQGSKVQCSTFAGGASSTTSCNGRWIPTEASTTPCFSATKRSAWPAASEPRQCQSSIAPTFQVFHTSQTC